MKRPFAGACYAASALQWGPRSSAAFGLGLGDPLSHAAPLLTQPPSAILDSASNAVSSAAAIDVDPATGILDAYMSALSARPLPTKMLTGAALAAAGDAIAQSREDEEYDPGRGASFAAFDAAYRAAQHALFPIVVEFCRGQWLLGAMAIIGAGRLADPSQLAAMERCLASQLIVVPFLYYPVFFALTGCMQGLDLDAGLGRARENFVPLMKRNLLFWIPVQYVQFGYFPTDLQIPFLSAAGLGWTFILSVLAGSARGYSNDDAEREMADCVESTAIAPDDELFPVIDFDRDNRIEMLSALNDASESMSRESEEGAKKMEERELLMKS